MGGKRCPLVRNNSALLCFYETPRPAKYQPTFQSVRFRSQRFSGILESISQHLCAWRSYLHIKLLCQPTRSLAEIHPGYAIPRHAMPSPKRIWKLSSWKIGCPRFADCLSHLLKEIWLHAYTQSLPAKISNSPENSTWKRYGKYWQRDGLPLPTTLFSIKL